MPALLIINYDVSDPESLAAYRALAGPVLAPPGIGQRIARTDATIDLGEGEGAGSNTAIVRYDSVKAARLAYDSGAYQDLLAQRLTATHPRFAIIVPIDD